MSLERNKLYGAIAFVVLLVLGLIIQHLADQGILRMFLFFGSFLIVGFASTTVKRGFILSFIVSLILTLLEYFLVFGTVSSQVLTTLVILIFITSLLSGLIGAVGSFLGKRIPWSYPS